MSLKIGGVEVSGPSEEVLVLPRLKGEIVFRAIAVMNMDEFNKLCPEPKARKVLKAGGWSEDKEDSGYKEAMAKYGTDRWNWIVLKSLEPSEIEWQTVDMGNPATWENWTKELQDAGLSTIEVNRVGTCVMAANSLDDRKLDQARRTFLHGLEAAEDEKSSGPSTEPQNTPSGERANDSE